ncbi:MAG: biotin attachment protein [Caulobacteraceae bacterium]|nr:MAG: biotin attachment protein [Caulobacteraceae bacterium]
MDIHVPDTLWALSMLPVGTLECWSVDDGAVVALGDALAEVRIEDALHEILAPAAGRVSITLPANSIIEPGAVLGRVMVA